MNVRQRAILFAAVLAGLGYVWLRGGFIPVSEAVAGVGNLGRFAGPGLHGLAAAPARVPGLLREPRPTRTAVFAGGCFWSMEKAFDELPVVSTTSGFTGGRVANPTYDEVARGGTGHAEAVLVTYDPAVVTYQQLLDHYLRNVDPFVSHRQFCDVGDEYRPEIFVASDEERVAAAMSLSAVAARFGKTVEVRIGAAAPFYPAEPYHQDYHRRYAAQYSYYRWRCGRDARLAQIWGSADAGKGQ
jgi:peptide-methionine (S)-S-oxide reductase